MMQYVTQTAYPPAIDTVIKYILETLRLYLIWFIVVIIFVLILLLIRYNRPVRDSLGDSWRFVSRIWNKVTGYEEIEVDVTLKGQVGGTEFQVQQPIRKTIPTPKSDAFIFLTRLTERILGLEEKSSRKTTRKTPLPKKKSVRKRKGSSSRRTKSKPKKRGKT